MNPRIPASLLMLALTLLLVALPLHAGEPPPQKPLRIGLTPVFLDYQAGFVKEWRRYLEARLGQPVSFVQRGTYREITDLLREGKLEFAWLCAYPYVRNKSELRLVAVPLYQGEPLYQSYLIVPAADKQTRSLDDLRQKSFAFADPDSNSGHLYPEYQLTLQGETPAAFFSRSFFTWSHRKVIEAVASGMAQGGAVDGYVWDTLAKSNPELTAQTRVVSRSPKFGHPPFVASRNAPERHIAALQQVLLQMAHDEEGGRLLNQLNLDGFVYGSERLYDSVEEMARLVEQRRQ